MKAKPINGETQTNRVVNLLVMHPDMTLLQARQATGCGSGGLGDPSKMPGRSYGISALKCKNGSKLRKIPGSVCFDCFAMKGHYTKPTVKNCHKNRLRSIKRGNEWVAGMVQLITKQAESVGYFRWHDSGDIVDASHLRQIVAVCRQTPKIRHWLPTKEYETIRHYVRSATVPANLTIRVSAPMINGNAGKAPQIAGLPTSMVENLKTGRVTGRTFRCPAPSQGGHCGECRKCWSKVKSVTYKKH
jgi:hypothetical protein